LGSLLTIAGAYHSQKYLAAVRRLRKCLNLNNRQEAWQIKRWVVGLVLVALGAWIGVVVALKDGDASLRGVVGGHFFPLANGVI